LPAIDEAFLDDARIADPERPMDPDYLMGRFVPEEERSPAGRRLLAWFLSLLGLLLLAMLWRWTPVHDWLDLSALATWLVELQQTPAAPLLVIAAFVLAGLLAVPLTLLIIVTALVFGPWLGFAYALAGALASALTGFVLGGLLGRKRMRRLGGMRIRGIRRGLERGGVLPLLLLRIIPVAGFTLINLLAGASRLSVRDFLLGSLLGMTPSILAIVVLVDRARASVQAPGLDTLLALAATAAAIGVTVYGLTKWLAIKARHSV
jgi:uncharacterized membrane protein YdjX (TVP38/TMEM64 family)